MGCRATAPTCSPIPHASCRRLFQFDRLTATPRPQFCRRTTPACSPAICRWPSSNTAIRRRSKAAICRMSGKSCPVLTMNYGLRFDHYNAFSSGSQVSPRVNFVWQPRPPPRFTPAIRASSPRRRSSWSVTSRSCSSSTPRRHPRSPGRSGQGGALQLLRLRRRTENHEGAYGRGRQLLQAGDGPDRRGPVRRAHHSHPVQLRPWPGVWRGIDGQLLSGPLPGLRQPRHPARHRQGHRVQSIQFRCR